MSEKKVRPVAVCTDCITYSFNEADINTHCTVLRGDRTCRGSYVDATDSINWKKCTACRGTGRAWDGNSCVACQESGWLLTRRR